jgi:hypothetical protein
MRRIVSSGTIALIAPAELTGAASVNGSGTSAEIGNVGLGGAHSDVPDVILSGFSFTRGTNAGSSAQRRHSQWRSRVTIPSPGSHQHCQFHADEDRHLHCAAGCRVHAGIHVQRRWVVVSGDTSADAEMLTEIRGCRALGY